MGHYGGFLLCLLHKASYYRNDDAYYIYVKTYSSQPTNDFMERISKTEIQGFGNVVCMEESIFWGLESEEATEQKVVEHYNLFFNKYDILLDKNTDIYMMVDDLNSMGIYLGQKRPLGVTGSFATSPEHLDSYIDMYIVSDGANRDFYAGLQRKYKTLDRDRKYVTKVIRTFNEKNLDNGKFRKEVIDAVHSCEYFDISAAKESLTNVQKDALQQLFKYEVEKTHTTNFNMLLLSSNISAFKMATTENEMIYGNQLLVDYFLGNYPLVIKPHPRADYGKEIWEKSFYNCTYIPGYLPAEYMEGLGINIDILLSTGSTGSGYASRTAKKKMNFGRSYWFRYQYLHRIYAVLAMSSFIGIKKFCYFEEPIQVGEMVNSLIQNNPLLQIFDNVAFIDRIDEQGEENTIIIMPLINRLGKDRNAWMMTDIKRIIWSNSKTILCFFDMGKDHSGGIWNEGQIKDQLLEFEIKKESIGDDISEHAGTERFHVYCPDIDKRYVLKQFHYSYTLKNAGLRICVSAKSESCVNTESKEDYILDTLNGMNASFSDMRKALITYMNFADERLRLIDQFSRYIDELWNIDKTIMISVRDTPGHRVTPELAKQLKKLGLEEDLHARHWNSYAAVIHENKLLFERMDEKEAVHYETSILSNEVSIYSAALKHGNKSVMEVNGRDYSMNLRGFNIVVYDMKNSKLIDSVCFDSHAKDIPCYRRS